MRLDDLGREAAAQARHEAADLGRIDLDRYRRRRRRRDGLILGTGGAVVLTAALALIASAPQPAKVAVTVPTTPSVTATTLPGTTTSSVPPFDIGPPELIGAGWELIEARSVAGRESAAVVWTEAGLVVWGGTGPSFGGTSDPFLYRGGSIRDSATGIWSSMAPVEADGLCGGQVRALAVGDRILFYGASGDGSCASAAIYHPGADTWFEVTQEFASVLALDTAVVWTGELVIAPVLGLAYHLHSNTIQEIPALAPRLDSVVSSPLRAHWTGSEVLAVGSGPVFAWAPGDSSWREVGAAAGVSSTGRTSVWTEGEGLWVVNYNMSGAVLGEDGWSSGGIPLTFSECVPEAVAVSGTPVVRTCSGLAIWDAARGTWVLAPLEVPGWGVHSDGVLLAAEDENAVYSVGSRIYRYRVVRDEEGAILSPLAVPIGSMELGSLDQWEFNRSFVSGPTVGVVLAGPSQCTITSTEGAWEAEPEFVAFGTMTIHNPGRAAFEATMYRSADAAARFGLAIPTEAETVFVRCDGGIDDDPALMSEHAFTLAARLWWPNRPLIEAPSYATGPGWESLDAGPIAGRMRVAAAWTGDELFVWGGHDGYSQETPGPEAFHQDAYLFNPLTDSWRQAAPPPDGLCAFTEADAIPIGERILLRGIAPDRDGCSQAAIYKSASDEWELPSGPLFDLFYFRTDLVWTGEWLVAPTAGLAWVPSDDETIGLPAMTGGEGSPIDAHWTGDRIVVLGGGDLYTLTPGDDAWVSTPGPPIEQGGRVSVWYSGGLWAAEPDHGAAMLDSQFVDGQGLARWYYSSLPLRNDECGVELLLAADRPVASTCVGMAIWDPARGSWIPVPASSSGWAWQPTLVGGDDAIYSIGDGFHRYPIEFDDGGATPPAISDPVSIPVGLALVETYGFHVLDTIGWSQVRYPGDFIGFSILVNMIGSQGDCEVIATLGGPPLGEPERVIDTWGYDLMVLPSERSRPTLSGTKPMTHLAVQTGDGEVVHIHCESQDDALSLARNLSIP